MTDRTLLVPLTPEARKALAGREHVEIDRLPFRIGRESRMAVVEGKLTFMERRKGNKAPNNDLYLLDDAELLNISREHLQIEKAADGEVLVYDRGSACGTQVDGRTVGGRDTTGRLALRNDSKIIIGTLESPYRFTVKHLEGLANVERDDRQRGG